MNIETRIDSRIWDAIKNSYENRNFTGAIQDSIYFLTDLIRDKSGLEGDGPSLIGRAFGGKSPLLKVNNLQTESEKNVQGGIEQILRGIYQAIRNPRSHDKHSDKEEDAVAIILFINLLVRIIDISKSPFSEQAFIARVLDPDFVTDERYAKLLVDEIPVKKRLDVFYGLFKRLSEGDGGKLKYFFDAFLKKLNKEERNTIYREISECLKHTDDIETIRTLIKSFSENWPEIDQSVRMRIENKLIKSIKKGKWHQLKQRCIDGAFGTFAINITKDFILKENLLSVLVNKLDSSDREEQDYVFKYFSNHLDELTSSPTSWLEAVVKKGLKNGDNRFKEMVEYSFSWSGAEWQTPFKDDIENFEEKPLDDEYDDGSPF